MSGQRPLCAVPLRRFGTTGTVQKGTAEFFGTASGLGLPDYMAGTGLISQQAHPKNIALISGGKISEKTMYI